jgi:replicative DNA helicase
MEEKAEYGSKETTKKRVRKTSLSTVVSDHGRVPPQAVDLEEAVLGALMLEKDAVTAVIDILKPELFYKDTHQIIFTAIMNLFKRSDAIDILTLTNELRTMGELETIGGAYYLTQLTNRVASAANIEYHARIISQKYIQRELIHVSSEIIKDAFEDTTDVFELLERAEGNLFAISEGNIRRNFVEINGLLKLAIAEIEAAKENNGEIRGVGSGFKDLDKVTCGWQKSDLIIFAARPGMGKAQPLTSKILKNDGGFKLMKDIKIGDKIVSRKNSCFVNGVFPQGRKQIYKIHFSDGRFCRCTEDHLWEVRCPRFFGSDIRVLQTKELIQKLKAKRYHRRISIPLMSGEWGNEKEFIIHPYLMGIFLGDGSLTHGSCWDKPDDELVYLVEKILPLNHYVKTSGMQRRVLSTEKVNLIRDELKKLCLLNKKSIDKFIPIDYLKGNRSQRLQLANGLLDTDGSVDKKGAIEFSSSSKIMAYQVLDLIRGLGYRCSLTPRKTKCHDSYRLIISGDNESQLFQLTRKKQKTKIRKIKPLTILSIEEDGFEECQCISVSDESGLYVTDDFILTHNTACALTMARNMVIDYKKPIAFFSLEMSAIQLVTRLIAAECDIPADRLRRGNMEAHQWEQLNARIRTLVDAPLFIDDTPALSIFELRAKARRLKAQHDIQMIIVDYLQLMSIGGDSRGGNREQEISQISRSLKALAKELDIPIIALSQLSRNVENRGGNKKPILSDLRESGAIEQDADIVCFIYRPEYYKIDVWDDMTTTDGQAEIIVAKHRNGALADVRLRFIGQYAKFEDLDKLLPGHFDGLEPNKNFGIVKTLPSSMNGNDPPDENPF